MLRTTFTAAWSHKRRLVGTALAIVLGTVFLSATLVLGDTARSGFEVAFREANAGTAAVVRSADALTGAEPVRRAPVAASVLDTVSEVDGVRRAVPTVEGTGQVLDRDGNPIGGDGPPTVAEGWIEDPALTGWELAEGRGPDAAGEVVLDRSTARKAQVEPGDPVTVLVPEPVAATVVGIATFGDDDSLGGTTYAGFAAEEAQRLLLGSADLISGVVVAADAGVSQEQLVDRLATHLPDGVEAITGAELTEEMRDEIEGDFLGFLVTGLLVFAGIALLVAGFSIFNTFSILVAQRTRESALLRAIGASRRQVLASTLAESAVVGAAGSALGAGLGVLAAAGLLALMDSAGFGLPTEGLVVAPGTMATAGLVGLAVTMVGGALPAWRSSRVAPLAALRGADAEAPATSRARTSAGVLVAVIGLGGVVYAGGGDGRLPAAGLGSVAVVVGVLLVGPAIARPVSRVLGAPLARRGVSGELARRNAVRNPKRTASTAAALLVGVGVVSLFTVFGASVSRSIEDAVDRSFGGDLVLAPAGGAWSGAGMEPGLADRLDALPEVADAAGMGFGAAVVDGRQEGVGFADVQALARVADLDVVEGDLARVGDDGVAMDQAYADEHDLAVGDVVAFRFVDGATASLRLAATYDARAIGGTVLVPQATWAAHSPQASYATVLVGLADGVDLDAGRAAVQAITEGAGAPDVMDRDEFVASQAAEVDVVLTIVYALLAIAIVIALMGIANTLSLSVHERTRELGLLRAVGQTRRQLRTMVRWEAVIVASFGAVAGVALGVFLGWGLVRAIAASEGFGSFAVPFGPLAVVLLVGATVGVLAAIRPAWRASRMDVLAAVTTE